MGGVLCGQRADIGRSPVRCGGRSRKGNCSPVVNWNRKNSWKSASGPPATPCGWRSACSVTRALSSAGRAGAISSRTSRSEERRAGKEGRERERKEDGRRGDEGRGNERQEGE